MLSIPDFNRRVYALLGLPLDAVSMDHAIVVLEVARFENRRCFLSTPNLNFLIASVSDTAFRESVCRSDLSVADGMPVVWIAKLLGIPIRERVAGSTVFEKMRHESGGIPWRVFFFGGGVGAAMHAFLNMEESHGILPVGFTYPGFVSLEQMSDDELIDTINASAADFLVVSLGAAKGQAWIMKNMHRLNPPVISHLGAVVNFVAGTVQRSPVWIQKMGLEWLWRIKEEPQLWRRYLKDGIALLKLLGGRVLPLVVLQALHKPSKIAVLATQYNFEQTEQYLSITVLGVCVEDNLQPLREQLTLMQETPCSVELNLAECYYVDSGCAGLLMVLDTWLQDHQLQLIIRGASPRVHHLLDLHGLPNHVLYGVADV